jgi:FAD/FMN-containing dehydrogenase
VPTDDYTQQQPIIDTLQQALDERIGAGRAGVGRVFRPSSVAEAAALLASADEFRAGVTVGRSSRDRIGLDLSGLTTIREVDTTSQLAIVEYGVTPRVLDLALASHGLELPPFVFADLEQPIGAALSEGQGAALAMAVEALLADGTAFHTAPAPRRAAGPAPEALILGQHHRFGVLMAATLRVGPAVSQPVVWVHTAPRADAMALARTIATAGVPLAAGLWCDGAKATLVVRAASAVAAVIAPLLGEPAAELPSGAPAAGRLTVGVVPTGATRICAWSAVRDQVLAATKKAPVVVAPLGPHGGLLRGDAAGVRHVDAATVAVFEAIRERCDPRGTLSPLGALAALEAS